MKTLQTVFDNLRKQADSPAVVAMRKDGPERLTAEDLDKSSRRLARGLLDSGLNDAEPVILQGEPSTAWLIAALAVLQAGGTVVPLDTQLEDDVLSEIVADSGAQRVFCDGAHLEFFADRSRESDLDRVVLDSSREDANGWQSRCGSGTNSLPEPEPDQNAAIFYTSGTTGPPKGVPLSHRNLAFQVETLVETGFISASDRLLLPLPLHHVYPFVIGMLLPLGCGASIVLPRSMTGPEILKAARTGKASILLGVPRLYDALYSSIHSQFASRGWFLEHGFEALVGLLAWLRRRFDIRPGRMLLKPLHDKMGSELNILASGGSAIDPDLAWKLEGIGWRISIGYGLTETSPLLTLNPPGSPKLGSVGRAVPGVEIRIDPSAHPQATDADDAQPTRDTGTEGEILARGPGVFAGYHNLPEKTAETFSDGGWFRTGDLGRFDAEGYLFIEGRVSELIVTEGGENIQPEQVEEAYARSEVIREIGILQANGELAAVIVPELEAVREQQGDDLKKTVRDAVEQRSQNLPSYQQIADFVVVRKALPRTRLGKIRRHLLRERYREAKEGAAEEPQGGPMSPEEMPAEDRTLLENREARKTWKLLARRYSDRRLTPDTSPRLDLGIDSMGWLDLTLSIRERTGVELDEEQVAGIRKVRDLLKAVAESSDREDREDRADADLFEDPEGFLEDKQKRWLEPTGPVLTAVARTLFGFNRWLLQRAFRLSIQKRENLPDSSPYVLTPNHISYLDSFALAAAVDFNTFSRTFWGGWTGVAFRNFFTRFISRLAQVVPVDPEEGFLSSMAFGAAILQRKNNLIWYPEGQRSPDGRLQAFKPGIGALLAEFPVPVVPVYIRGTYEAWPTGRFFQRFHPVTVKFGEPLNPEDLQRQGSGDSAQERITTALHAHMAEALE